MAPQIVPSKNSLLRGMPKPPCSGPLPAFHVFSSTLSSSSTFPLTLDLCIKYVESVECDIVGYIV
jgi:hypothetical protein